MVGIVDYGAGNLHSVVKAVQYLGGQVKIISNSDEWFGFDNLILPGVGNAGKTMRVLEERGLAEGISSLVNTGVPFLGICLGMQLLMDYSDESQTNCLGIIPGDVRLFAQNVKVPHMGWNQVKQGAKHPLFNGIPDESDFYFVHSFFVKTKKDTDTVGFTAYGGHDFASVVAADNVFGVQFHPEKSGELGLIMIKNFLQM